VSLAERIASQLNGRKSGNGWSIPAICHNPDSSKFNLQISDGENGKLTVFCHSRGCDYQSIMQTFENAGLKPRDALDPAKQKQRKAVVSRIENLKSLNHEIFVLTRFIDSRLNDRAKAQDKNYLKFNPQFRQMPGELWEREALALKRINSLTGELLR